MNELLPIIDEFNCKYCIVNEDDISYIILAMPYSPYSLEDGENSYIDAFYPASNAVYHIGKSLEGRLVECGYNVINCNINLKDMAERGGLGSKLHNQLITNRYFGSRLALFGIAISGKYEYIINDRVDNYCERCSICDKACPKGALINGTFIRENCIRQWQSSPNEYGRRNDGKILGCDICQRVCPHNKSNEIVQNNGLILGIFTISQLRNILDGSKADMDMLGQLIGKNYARRSYIKALLDTAGLDADDKDNR